MLTQPSETEDFITIIAPSTDAAMRQFKAQGLDVLGYAITGRIGRHRFSIVEGERSAQLFEGQELIAATFSRRIAR